MKEFIFIFLWGVCCYAQKLSNDLPKAKPNCINPAGQYGNCIPLTQCESLFKILKNRPIYKEDLRFLQKSTCGFRGEEPTVCCSQSNVPGTNELLKNDKERTKTGPGQIPPSDKIILPLPPQKQTIVASTSEKPTKYQTNQILSKPSPSPLLPETVQSLPPPPKPSPQDYNIPQESQKPSRPLPPPPPSLTTSTNDSIPIDDSPRGITLRVIRNKNFKLLPALRDCGVSFGSNRIIGGAAAGLGTYPWMVLIGYTDPEGQKQFACAGSIINSRYILTAAHCIDSLPPGYRVSTIRIGEYDQKTDPDCELGICAPRVVEIAPEELIVHEQYDLTRKKENDIAIIRLERDIKFGPFVTPVCLPYGEYYIRVTNTTRLSVAGWGRLTFDNPDNSDVLQDIRVPVVSMRKCNEFYGVQKRFGEIDKGRFCAGGESGRDSCKGDSGGPMMEPLKVRKLNKRIRSFQFGIVSVGPARCGTEGQPALYTKVSYFLPWILDNMRP